MSKRSQPEPVLELNSEEECNELLKKAKLEASSTQKPGLVDLSEFKVKIKTLSDNKDQSCEGDFCLAKKRDPRYPFSHSPNKARWLNCLTNKLECDWCSHMWMSSTAGLQSLSPTEFGDQLLPLFIRDHWKLRFDGFANGALKYYQKNERNEKIKVYVQPPHSLYLWWVINNDNPDAQK